MRRLAMILWWAPFVLAPVVFICVPYASVAQNEGGIAEGFRNLNVILSVMFPLGGVCWGIALLITGYLDLPLIPLQRLRAWGVVFALVIVLAIACYFLEK